MGALEIFPISYKVRDHKILIVGGGAEALGKARLAAKTCARVVVVSKKFSADFSELRVELERRALEADDLQEVALIFVATTSADADLAIRVARQSHIPLNVVDRPELCDFYTPAVIDRAPVSVAISTQGTAPVLARLVRARIEAALDPNLGMFAQIAGEMRQLVERVLPSIIRRRRYYERFFETMSGHSPDETAPFGSVREKALDVLAGMKGGSEPASTVWLVGAGPGAADLLTLKAQRLLQQADVIAYEEEIPHEVVQMGRRDAHLIAVARPLSGMKEGKYKVLLGDLAKTYKKIVWLMRENPAGSAFAPQLIHGLKEVGLRAVSVPGVTTHPAEPVSPASVQDVFLPPAAFALAGAIPHRVES